MHTHIHTHASRHTHTRISHLQTCVLTHIHEQGLDLVQGVDGDGHEVVAQ
jgi:hypothetical protein